MKKKNIIIISILVILVLIAISTIVIFVNYTATDMYKLKKMGYSKEEINLIKEKNINILTILENEKINIIKELLNEKYFLNRKFNRYIEYYNKNKDELPSKIISIVNSNQDKKIYENVKEIYSVDYDILVNKHFKLEDNFLPDDLVDISVQYAYANQRIRKEVNTAYVQMARNAKKDGITLIVSTSFRTYEKQTDIYNTQLNKMGQSYADTYTARPGHSEHQTGLALDILTNEKKDFEETDAYNWLKENSYLYGFIERYQKDKEDLTSFQYEPWHYRYVGTEIAKIIHDENITFEEYYTYYIEKY